MIKTILIGADIAPIEIGRARQAWHGEAGPGKARQARRTNRTRTVTQLTWKYPQEK